MGHLAGNTGESTSSWVLEEIILLQDLSCTVYKKECKMILTSWVCNNGGQCHHSLVVNEWL